MLGWLETAELLRTGNGSGDGDGDGDGEGGSLSEIFSLSFQALIPSSPTVVAGEGKD